MDGLSNYVVMILLFLSLIRLILKEKPVKESLRGVIIILLIGGYTVINSWEVIVENNKGILVIFMSLLLGLIFGLLRGVTTKLFYLENEGKWMRKGTWLSIVVFIVGMIVTHIVIDWITKDSKTIISISQTLHMGISMFGSRMVWQYKIKTQQSLF
jgi:peptidoglycan/LPS O-acetylase OafA/YrhL